jgi:hypothetical protein
MLAESLPAKARGQGADQAFLSLSTLGAKRSPRGLILGIVGACLLAGWFGLETSAEMAAENLDPESGEFKYEGLALSGLILVAAGGLTWWWERAAGGRVPCSGMKDRTSYFGRLQLPGARQLSDPMS